MIFIHILALIVAKIAIFIAVIIVVILFLVVCYVAQEDDELERQRFLRDGT